MRVARGDAEETRNVTILKIVIWLGLAAVLMVAKLWPLAFMVLIAAGGVMAIETWRGKKINEEVQADAPPASFQKSMTGEEALSVLGLPEGASADDIKAAHKKLIAQIHPDKGGTDYLAAKINEARDFLLQRAVGARE